MITYRLLPPTNVHYQTLTVNGRSYTGAPGQVLDVPDFDAQVLCANGWTKIATSGPTSARPGAGDTSGIFIGSRYFDTTIGALIVFDGKTWRSPVDGSPA